MTELDSYSINNTLKTEENRAGIAPVLNKTTVYSKQLPVVAHYPRLDSKLILQNMEEVLDTVKKQHKEKHKRKRQLKKLAAIKAVSGSEILQPAAADTKVKKREHSEKKQKRRDKEKQLQDKSTGEDDKALQVSPAKCRTILHHFPRTPKKEENSIIPKNKVEVISENESENIETKLTPSKNAKVATNAFEVMMNARNKSIGSNSPGREFPSPVLENELSAINAKRKLRLQEWSDLKGGAKRRLEEESRAAYVEEQLEQRAKRFKQMLVSGSSLNTSSPSSSKTELKKVKNKLIEKSQRNKKKRRKRYKERLNSVDSTDSLESFIPTKVEDETSEFLSKLNSPTKKRDSLLGYFNKKESPIEGTSKRNKGGNIGTPKERAKGVSSRHSTSAVVSRTLQENLESKIDTPSGRPRRSCVGKARYDYDLEISPTKNTKLTKNNPVRKTLTLKGNTRDPKVPQVSEGDNIIILDDTTSFPDVPTPQGTPKRLAPLFVRTVPKPSPDPEILKARKAFLQSGVPEKLRVEQEKQKQCEQNFEEATEIFPKISHVQQLSNSELETETGRSKCLKLNSDESILLSPSAARNSKSRSYKRQSIGLLSDCIPRDFQQLKNRKHQKFSLAEISLPSLANKRTIIKNWKAEFERFPTYKCYNQMREKYRYFSAIDSTQDTEQVTESFMVTRQTRRSLETHNAKEPDNPDEEYKPPISAPNGELLFSEKYKPLLFEQVLVNLNPVTQLKDFLSNWSSSGSGSAKNSQPLDISMDLNDSTCSNQGPAINTVVLLGPVSSGKTNAVFTLANEMDFNVLEVNAGMKRTGKRLIQELQEATQSHQIRKADSGSISSQKSLLKMSLNGLKTKLKNQDSKSNQVVSQNADSHSSDLQYSARKCLILIEDADIVFEQSDAGFTDAIYSLAASSKRPVIATASNPNCAHLQRLISQNTIHFAPPNVLNISKFLAVLSLIENCPVQLDDLISLYLYNRRDLRKTILELQFFIQSGGDRQPQSLEGKGIKEKEQDKANPNYFASPRKRQFSVEQSESEAHDTAIFTDKNNITSKSSDRVYMHRSLFEYYTVGQNSNFRIPYPVDFHLLNVNLNEIFKVSRTLRQDMSPKASKNTQLTTTNRKLRSPKKQWLTTVGTYSNSPLDNLCSFYENLSIAALMDVQDSVNQYQCKQTPSITDRLKPNIFETISHCLLEKAIEVNLDAESCPYNLFDSPKTSVSLCEQFGSIQLRSKRALYLDYEPSLRSICHSEKIRSTLERRSTRFYHYLRNYCINVSNFSTAHFDCACKAFQISEPEEKQNGKT